MKVFTSLFLSALISNLALAHVTMESSNMTVGGYSKLTFRVPHGCEGSATTKITVRLPEGILSVKPQVHPGWNIVTKEVKLKKPTTLHGKPVTEVTSEVSWSGGPLSDKYMDEFGMSVLLPNKSGEKLFFPVIQECEKGTSQWTETIANGRFPAPSLELNAESKSGEPHH